MKPMKIKIQPPKRRMHQVLFDDDLPFRGRKEESKLVYKRKSKHRSRPDARDIW